MNAANRRCVDCQFWRSEEKKNFGKCKKLSAFIITESNGIISVLDSFGCIFYTKRNPEFYDADGYARDDIPF